MDTRRIFKRKIYERLLKWKETSNGNSALLVQGARRIGKSTIVEEFARREYTSYILIDFTKCSQEVFNLFDDVSDLNYIFLRLQLIYHVQLVNRNSLIVFDEVQFQPKARQAIKSFVADHRYDYIETGSLISIRKNIRNILIPSEEERIDMFPMDYEEFRWALGDTATVPLLRSVWEHPQPLKEAHRKLMRDFRLYMLVGGMPQAVNAYLETNNFEAVDHTKRMILNIYDEDFGKIDPSGKAARIFAAIPAQLNNNASRYQISSVIAGAKAEDYIELISEMENKKIFESVAEKLNLPVDTVEKTYKAYWQFIRTKIQELPLSENITEEQFKKLKTNFNIPSLGKLNCTYERYMNIMKNFEYIKKLKNDKRKGNKTSI